MREILFRGKLKYTNLPHQKGDWVYGDYVKIKDGNHVMHCIYGYGEVFPETVSQYTGFTDRNDKRIFEGDIIRNIDNEDIGVVRWYSEHGAFMIRRISDNQIFWLFDNDFSKIGIVGNIHDNPELIGG